MGRQLISAQNSWTEQATITLRGSFRKKALHISARIPSIRTSYLGTQKRKTKVAILSREQLHWKERFPFLFLILLKYS